MTNIWILKKRLRHLAKIKSKLGGEKNVLDKIKRIERMQSIIKGKIENLRRLKPKK